MLCNQVLSQWNVRLLVVIHSCRGGLFEADIGIYGGHAFAYDDRNYI